MERAPARQELVGGVLKSIRDPVLVLLGTQRVGSRLSCDWVFTHAGLVPGPYELESGQTVLIPPALTRRDAPGVHRGVTLEVT